VKLVVGPELALFGGAGVTLEECRAGAIEIPGPETDRLVEKAREHNCYISPGSTFERDDEGSATMMFNTQLLVGPEGILYAYRKLQPYPTGETAQMISPQDLLSVGYDTEKHPLFPVVETEIGRLGGFICYDCMFPEIARQLAFQGCEIFLGSTAWFDPFGQPPLDWWKSACRVRSMENVAYGVYSSSAVPWTLGGLPLSGGSFISDFQGRVLAEATPGEGWTYATLDIDALRDQRMNVDGGNTLAHLRMSAFDYWTRDPGFTADPTLRERTPDDNAERFSRETKRFWSSFYSYPDGPAATDV
jgi:predicted amidohydrolase